MSVVVMNPSQASAPGPLTNRAGRAWFGAHGADGSYAIWKEIFDRGRAAEPPQDQGDLPAPDRQPAHPGGAELFSAFPSDAQVGRDGYVHFAVTSAATMHTAPATPSSKVGVATRALAPMERGSVGAASVSALAAPMCAASSQSRNVAAPAYRATGTTDIVRSLREAPVAAEVEASTHEPADSVSVFASGAAVTIVLRDLAISKEEALRCAFETARELTGRRETLQQLILNGRIVYLQQGKTSANDSAHGSSLLFAC